MNIRKHRNHILEFRCVVAALIVIVIVGGGDVVGQNRGTHMASDSLGFSSQSDATALAVLRQTLLATGGVSAWENIHSVKMHNVIYFGKSPTAYTQLIMEDWSSPYSARNLVSIIGSETESLRAMHTEGGGLKSSANQASTVVVDWATLLADHLPSAAAAVILKSDLYVIKTVDSVGCDEGYICVDIYRKASSHAMARRVQEWTISKTSYLPATILLASGGMQTVTGRQWTRVSFNSYESQSDVLIPSTVTVIQPWGATEERRVSAIIFGAEFSRSSFDREAYQ